MGGTVAEAMWWVGRLRSLCGGWLYSDYNASLSSNWTELDWTGTELGKMILRSQNISGSYIWQSLTRALQPLTGIGLVFCIINLYIALLQGLVKAKMDSAIKD